MVQDPNNPQGGGDAPFGFGQDAGAPPKDEKYNTRFIVASMQKERRQSQVIVFGIIAAVVLGLVTWTFLSGGDKPKAPAAAGAAAVDKGTDANTAPAAEAKPDAKPDAKPVEGAAAPADAKADAKPAEAKPADAKADDDSPSLP